MPQPHYLRFVFGMTIIQQVLERETDSHTAGGLPADPCIKPHITWHISAAEVVHIVERRVKFHVPGQGKERVYLKLILRAPPFPIVRLTTLDVRA